MIRNELLFMMTKKKIHSSILSKSVQKLVIYMKIKIYILLKISEYFFWIENEWNIFNITFFNVFLS